jgi:membrane protein YqaA with SNARE-associated domain
MPRTLTRHLYGMFAHLGGFGLLGLGILDSSILFVPLGNDLLFIAMTVRNHRMMIYYAVMAAIGSVIGCLTVDLPSRKGGEKGLQRAVPRRYLPHIKKVIEKRAGWALAFASLMPPPFPFTAFVAAAAGLQYSRRKLVAVVSASRLARFLIEGGIAILIGRRLLRWANSPVLEYIVVALIVASVVGSLFPLVGWIKRRRIAATI